MWGLFVGAVAAVLAPIGPGALVPLKLAVASADSVGNDVYVAVVVDFGNGSGMSTVSKCVPVPSSARDSDALAAAVGSSNVAYASSGLLCAIDNYPTNGVQNCGQSVGNGDYDYWSYWHGSSGSWVYASNGPTEQSVSSPGNDVEGLRFQFNEPDTPSSPPPSVAPSYAQICNASTEVPPAQSSSNTPTTTLTTRRAVPDADDHHHGRRARWGGCDQPSARHRIEVERRGRGDHDHADDGFRGDDQHPRLSRGERNRQRRPRIVARAPGGRGQRSLSPELHRVRFE